MTESGPPKIAPVIKRNGTVIERSEMEHVITVQVDRGFGLVGRAKLRLSDRGFTLSKSTKFALGTVMSIGEPQGQTLLEGKITGISLEQPPGANPELVVVIDDAAYDLARGTQQMTHLNGTYAQVIETIASRHGLTPQVGEITGSEDYLLQVGTDLDYLNSIVGRIGFVWWIDGPKTLVVEKPELGSPVAELLLNPTPSTGGGQSLTSFSVRASALRPTGLTVSGWDPDQQQDLTGTSSESPGGTPPALITKYLGTGPSQALSAATTAVAEPPPRSVDEATQLANSLYADWTSAAVVARGTCGVNGAIKPGTTVKIGNAGPAEGNYLVSEVQHSYDRSGFNTRFTAGPRRASGLVDTLGATPPSPGFLMAGLIVAKVTDNNDPDKAGRVKLEYAGENNLESPWARVVTLGAGAARGVVFQPEIKDEVLVGFEHGDTRRPVVIGGLYSKENTLPTGKDFVAGGMVGYRRITSRKNHVIEMADGEGPDDQHILLQTGTATHKLRLGADRFDIEVASGIPLTIKAGSAMFDINAAGNISIEGKNVTIKADGNLTLLGGTKAALGSNGQTQVQGATVGIKADGMGSVESGGPLTIKGAIVGIN